MCCPITLLARCVLISSHRQICMYYQRYLWDLDMYILFWVGLLEDKLLGGGGGLAVSGK